MDLELFVNQLNQFLQSAGGSDKLEGVCDLLRVHTGASVCVKDRDGRVMAEFLTENDGGREVVFETGCIALKRNCIFNKDFSDDERLAANIALAICTLLTGQREGQISADKKRRANAVRAIINSLSFSELEAATHAVVKSLGEKGEGIITSGHIADKLGFARSVVTGALRKLEGADLIETRSLGMKGTYIRVKDTLLAEELGKL